MDSFFFQDKLEQSFNRVSWWCDYFEEHENLINERLVLLLSHVINMDHIWMCRLKHLKPDSEPYDVHQIYHLKQLNHASKMEWMDFWINSTCFNDHHEKETQVSLHFLKDVTFNLFLHHAKHIGQISLICKEIGLIVDEPKFHLIE